MEACIAVERDIDKVLSKFNGFSDYASTNLATLRNDIENLQKQIDEVGEGELTEVQTVIINDAVNRVKDVVTRLSTQHRDLHSSVSKVGKTIDKNFNSDFGCGYNDCMYTGEKIKLVNEVICQHFFREGLLDVAENLITETGLKIPEEAREPFLELNRILNALKEKNLEPALQWVEDNRVKLKAQKSSLEFKLHCMAYINLISEGPHRTAQAIHYARKNLSLFVDQHQRAIQRLMGCLLYVKGGIDNSPYSELLSPCQWLEICQIFTRDACTLLGLSVDSPLAVCVNAGCTALPVLLNIKQMMQQHIHTIWNNKEELPVEIDLGSQCQYHSIFACPILRQQATENNPPMRLICGHIISRDALNKLTNNNKIPLHFRLKCPYCPVEQRPSDAVHVYF